MHENGWYDSVRQERANKKPKQKIRKCFGFSARAAPLFPEVVAVVVEFTCFVAIAENTERHEKGFVS